jgi:cell division protease FtsH
LSITGPVPARAALCVIRRNTSELADSMDRTPAAERVRPTEATSDRRGAEPRGREDAAAPHLLDLHQILLVNYMLVSWLMRDDDPVMVPYTAFKAEAAKGNVESIYSQGAGIEGRFKTPVTWPPAAQADAAQDAPAANQASAGRPARRTPAPRTSATLATTLLTFVGPDLEAFLIEHDVEISAIPIREGSGCGTLLLGFGPALLIIAF